MPVRNLCFSMVLLALAVNFHSTVSAQSGTAAAMSCHETKNEIVARVGDQTILRYQKSVVVPPTGIDSVYRRSGYIHPICTPSGRVLSGDFAPDHPHQHAFFMAWVKSRFQGREIDFWNQKKRTGRVSHVSVEAIRSAVDDVGFSVVLQHEDTTDPSQPIVVLTEEWQVKILPPTERYFTFDFRSTQVCIAQSSLELEKHVYGGMGFRGASQWLRSGAQRAFTDWQKQAKTNPQLPPPGLDVMGHGFLTSSGKQRHDGNHKPANWVAIFGAIDSQLAGLAVIGHPKNFRSPQPARLHPHKPYFSFSPIVDEAFSMEPRQPYTTRFRVIAFDGAPNVDLLNQQFELFSSE